MKSIALLMIMFSVGVFASRQMTSIEYVDLPSTHEYVPYAVIVPHHVSSEFVRFIHPSNGKSVVATVVDRRGDHYKVDPSLGAAMDLTNPQSDNVFVEDIY